MILSIEKSHFRHAVPPPRIGPEVFLREFESRYKSLQWRAWLTATGPSIFLSSSPLMSDGVQIPKDTIAILGVVFLAILLDWFLFGVISQQFYSYWISGFKDSRRVKAFVTAQYCLIVFQSILLCRLALSIYTTGYMGTSGTHFKSFVWQGVAGSLCQCTLILMANIFLANRVYTLTKSHLQSGSIIILSGIAFVFGTCTVIIPSTSKET